ncbi:MAG TPA: hypothetical protein PLM25_07655 [Limnochordia bacterium]|nr:hypothetical protein [Limnochordia bacterium]
MENLLKPRSNGNRECPELEEVVYFIAEGSDLELHAAQSSGFEILDHYRCYKRVL